MLFKKALSDDEKSFIREYVAEGLGDEDRKARRKEMQQEFGVSIKTIAAITAWTTIRMNQAMDSPLPPIASESFHFPPAAEDLGEDVYEDVPENEGSIRKKGGEHFDYNNAVKDAWRDKNRDYVEGNTTRNERRKMKVLMLPGVECIEAEMYLDMGFEPQNITGVEGGDREARAQFKINAEKLGINYKLGRLEKILPSETTPYGVVSLDFLGQLCIGYIKMLRHVYLDKRALVLTNLMGRRETKEMQWRMKAAAYFVGQNREAFTLGSIAKFGMLQAMKSAIETMKGFVSPSLKDARDDFAWIEMFTSTGMERVEHKAYPEITENMPTAQGIKTLSASSQRFSSVIHSARDVVDPIKDKLIEQYPRHKSVFESMTEQVQPLLALGMGMSSILKSHKGYKYMSKVGRYSIPYLTDFMEVERPVALINDVRHSARFLLENTADYLHMCARHEVDRSDINITDKNGRIQHQPLETCNTSDRISIQLHSGKMVEIKIGKLLQDIRTAHEVLGENILMQQIQNPQMRELIEP